MSKLTALAEYVHTWAPIATQLLASDNDAVKIALPNCRYKETPFGPSGS